VKLCAGCGEEFPEKYPDQKYHDHPCFLRHVNRDRDRQKAKGEKGGAVAGKLRKESAREDGYRGYVKEPGDRHQHRVVAERVLGRALAPGETVHHEDLDKTNNDPANLIVFSRQADHARHHKLNHPGLPSCDCPGIRLKEVMPDATP
jgi:hypothetical protein